MGNPTAIQGRIIRGYLRVMRHKLKYTVLRLSLMKTQSLGLALLFLTLAGSADETIRNLIVGEGGQVDFGKSVPGAIDITGDGAFPLLQDKKGLVLAAASEAGDGRVVAYSHGGFLKSGALLEQSPILQMVQNSIRWAGRSRSPVVGLFPGMADLAETMEEAGFETKVFPVEELNDHKVGVYCVVAHSPLSEGDIIKLFEFVNDGGGLVTATTPWAFKKKFPNFADLPGNQLLAFAGIKFLADGTASRAPLILGQGSSPANAPVTPDPGKPTMLKPAENGSGAVRAAERLASGEEKDPGARADLIGEMLGAKSLEGSELASFLSALKQLNETVGPIIPNKENPVVPGEDSLVDAIIELETHFNENAPAGTMYAIPAAVDYPGEVPDEAERISKTLTIDGTHRGWLEGRSAGGWAAKEMRPTGIYAVPGEVVRVTMSAKLAGEGFEVVIGSYNGHLRNRDTWHRYPDWQTKTLITERVTEASNGLGGLVTIRVPRGAEYDDLEVTIEGGVAAPLYVHGETDLKEWTEEIRRNPAPWAELASERMIVALPSEYIRKLTNPDEVMEVWNGIIDHSAVLVGVDRNDYRAERIVFDRQTSAGSMHSSYPVAAHQGSSAEMAVDAKLLKSEGNWGFFHEYGHNHQHNLWSLPKTGETTCNLWAVYVYEEYIGKNRNDTHRAIRPLDRRQRISAYFEGGAKFEEWSTWVALETYLMVQEKFGWEPFTSVFVEYNQLPPDKRPKGQQEINDQWVIRLSKACGMNLEPFWSIWNLPLSDSVSAELRDLPVWEDHPVARFAKSES